MSTHNIGFYEDLTKIIFQFSSNTHFISSDGKSLYLLTLVLYEPRCEKTGLWDFRPGPTQTRLYSNRRWLEA